MDVCRNTDSACDVYRGVWVYNHIFVCTYEYIHKHTCVHKTSVYRDTETRCVGGASGHRNESRYACTHTFVYTRIELHVHTQFWCRMCFCASHAPHVHTHERRDSRSCVECVLCGTKELFHTSTQTYVRMRYVAHIRTHTCGAWSPLPTIIQSITLSRRGISHVTHVYLTCRIEPCHTYALTCLH